jgi:ankyrin repeat protein
MAGITKFGVAKSAQELTAEGLTQSLVAAILKNDVKGINNLLSQGAPLNASDPKGNSMLVIAATDPRDHKSLDALLAAKADANFASANGKLPLNAVLRMKDARLLLQAVTSLLRAGANPNLAERREGPAPMTALQTAWEQNRDDKVIEALLTAGADPLIGEDEAQGLYSPFHAFAAKGRYAVLEAAHAAGVNIDAPACNGMTALMLAAQAGAVKTIESLLECGADPTLKDKKGMDAIAYARTAPPDTDIRPLLKQMARAARDHSLKREIAALRAEVDALKQHIKKAG